MKSHLLLRTYGMMGLAVLSLVLASAVSAQTVNSTTTAATPANPTGSEETTKPANDSLAQQRTASQDTSQSQTTMSTTPTPASPSGSEETSKPDTDSVAQQRTAGQDANQTQTTSPSQEVPDNANRHMTQDNPSTSAYSDKHFLTRAAEGGLIEVRLGQLAQQNGGSDQVKQFGARMVTDHSKANSDLKALAQQKGITVPNKLDSRHQAMVDRLSKLTGPAFDRAYVNDMVKDHQRDVSEFENASASSQDPEVKAFADRTLPVIKSHLSDVQGLQSGLK